MLRGDDVENIYLIENHHEALGYWRNMHISNTISHRIDFLKDVDRIVALDNGCIKEETTYNKYAMK